MTSSRKLVVNGTFSSASEAAFPIYLWLTFKLLLSHVIVYLVSIIVLVLSPIGLVVAMLTGGMHYVRGVVMTIFYLWWTAIGALLFHGTSLFCLLTGSLPYSERWTRLHTQIGIFWVTVMFVRGSAILNKKIYYELPEHQTDAPVIMFCRHISSADAVLAPWFAGKLGYQPRMIMKRSLMWDPAIGSLGTRCRCFFIERSAKGADMDVEMRGMTQLLPVPAERNACLTLYPEGTRATQDKRRAVLRTLERNKSHLLEYARSLKQLLPPRLHGSMALLRENVCCDLLFVGHIGYDSAMDIWDLMKGATDDHPIYVKSFRVSYKDIPKDEAGREKLLLDQWKLLDTWIDDQKAAIKQNPEAYWKKIRQQQLKQAKYT